MKVFPEFFSNGILNPWVKETYICLIPKKLKAVKVSNYQPISLVTIIYKIVAKVLANRMRTILLLQFVLTSQRLLLEDR